MGSNLDSASLTGSAANLSPEEHRCGDACRPRSGTGEGRRGENDLYGHSVRSPAVSRSGNGAHRTT